jgi:hypothetical protein
LRAERSCKHVLHSPVLRFQWFWPVAAVGILAVLSLIPPVGRRMPVQQAAEWPAAALDWIEAQGIEGRFFGPPDYGSYVTWRLGDRGRSYVDTRSFFFPAELIEDSHYLPQLLPGWRDRLDRVLSRDTDYFLLETTGARGQLWHSLQPHVGSPLYLDDKSVLLSAGQVRAAVAQLDLLPSPPLRGRGVGGEGAFSPKASTPSPPTPLPRVQGRGASGIDSPPAAGKTAALGIP